MFFERAEDEVVRRVEQRVAAWTMLPLENAEGMQVLHYKVRVQRGCATESWHFDGLCRAIKMFTPAGTHTHTHTHTYTPTHSAGKPMYLITITSHSLAVMTTAATGWPPCW
jgi:hypothetical protein